MKGVISVIYVKECWLPQSLSQSLSVLLSYSAGGSHKHGRAGIQVHAHGHAALPTLLFLDEARTLRWLHAGDSGPLRAIGCVHAVHVH